VFSAKALGSAGLTGIDPERLDLDPLDLNPTAAGERELSGGGGSI
jgi:hypothetical protein